VQANAYLFFLPPACGGIEGGRYLVELISNSLSIENPSPALPARGEGVI
jgi:hypothetical protein